MAVNGRPTVESEAGLQFRGDVLRYVVTHGRVGPGANMELDYASRARRILQNGNSRIAAQVEAIRFAAGAKIRIHVRKYFQIFSRGQQCRNRTTANATAILQLQDRVFIVLNKLLFLSAVAAPRANGDAARGRILPASLPVSRVRSLFLN